MLRTAWFLVGACLMTAVVPALAQDTEKKNPKTSYLDGKDAGPDFQIQGEYIGKVGANAFGLQVIARGDGKFDAVLLPGGLPGAGWDTKSRLTLSGKSEGDATNLKSDLGSIKIAGGNALVTWGDATGELKKLHRESPTLGQRAPDGATILFDGSNVDAWNPGKLAEPGLMGVGTRTKEKFGSFTLHLEFRSPYMPYANGQARGNSGMYLHDQYECQILDSFGLEGKDNECGGIYINSKPLVNMCLPPLSWQTYDVEMTAAKLDDTGKVIGPATVTIKHNGIVIHDQLALKVTPGGGQKDQLPGALYLQDHGDAVRFRNIWIVKHDAAAKKQ